MKYCVLLAGGSGLRMESTGIPKQFLTLNDKPIIIITLQKILSMNLFDHIVVVCNKDYIKYLKNLLIENDIIDVEVTTGGSTRLNSTLSGLKFIVEKYGVSENDIFVAHDSVRPFIAEEIIKKNIEFSQKYQAATTVVNLVETIVESNEIGLFKAYPRENLYLGQSPQSFNIKYFLECADNVPEHIRDTYTDLSEVIMYNGGTVYPVLGDRNNIKITTSIDIAIAMQLLKNEK